MRKILLLEDGQDVAEYAIIFALILVLVIGTTHLVGSNANNVFSSVASEFQTQPGGGGGGD
jgi:Flp pilus assembly pilin Flp